MEVCLNYEPEIVHVSAVVRGPGIIGDFHHSVKPGDDFLGWSYDELLALGEGRHELADKSKAAPAV